MTQPRSLADVLTSIDEKLRADSSRCQRCGRPKAGLCFAGTTKQEAGLCDCVEKEEAA